MTGKSFRISILLIFAVIAIVVATQLLQGCGSCSRFTAKYTGYDKVCVDGVEYIQFISGATVAYNTDGTIKQCKR